jgi:hypothetical protein
MEGLGLRVYVGREIVVCQSNLTHHGEQQTARQQKPQRPGLWRIVIGAKQTHQKPEERIHEDEQVRRKGRKGIEDE